MAESIKNRNLYSIDGTAARNLQPESMPLSERVWEKENKRRAKNRTYADRERVARANYVPVIDFFAMAILAVAIAMTVYSSIAFLKIQSNIRSYGKKTVVLENMTKELKTANDSLELNIEKSIDYDKILSVAVDELGMVYPYENQMISYKYEKKGYVRQYGDLTGNEQENTIDIILKLLFNK
ncbi:MAG: hypothetical protein K5858_00920 [Lachnospiraceae bacterium]|nr:hypothetical protein [Lachnospiraceae bacterium]